MNARDDKLRATQKLRHDLYRAGSVSELEAGLAARGVLLDRVLSEHGVRLEADGVLVVGSIAERLATPSSDLDLLVLVETSEVGLRSDAFPFRGRWAHETLTYRGGVEVNIEQVTRAALTEALRAFLDAAPLLYDASEVRKLSVIGLEGRQLMHRLRTGWIVRGRGIVERWRDEFLTVVFPSYMALVHFVSLNEFAEDAAALLEADDGSFTLAARESAVAGLFCLLALEGVTNQQPKWVARLATRTLRSSHPRETEMLLRVCFLELDPDDELRGEALDGLAAASESIVERMRSSPQLEMASAFLREHVQYTT